MSSSVCIGFHEEKVVGHSGEVIKAPVGFAVIGTAIIVTIARGEHDASVES